ncbi:Gfo/Idh/MocA family oxidoreductase [Modestobacter sp. VKM Ac-2977]|uniref:Gfo/Idh/MocA family protein n=1 Tax=Modestobacter sp. VKM Ac-2977 TaxID=3004131 RepID=UPI0022AAC567|nr:Gfo/Idh/MocA family oxidoreductase [Modestobacter sp. VKM Ac-2977]MCZ2820698.1 Gfo/Idh/MocA family oxidoreductase [Modestobacter sp. VKM Ac-2977]
MTHSKQPVRVAVVGAGNIADDRHLPALREMGERVEVVALADVDEPRARALAQRWDVPHAFGDLSAMLAAESPDLVVLCTPPVAHLDGVTTCLRAGAWVWCEKPPMLSLAELDTVAELERDGGPYATYVFQHRFGSGATRLRELVCSGELGRPLVAVCHTLWYRDPAYYEVPWRGRWATEGGGPTMGHGIHQMDLLLSLLGDWREVTAVTGTLEREVETEDVAMAVVTFASGAMATVVNSVLSPRETSYLRFDFTDATVELQHLYGYGDDDWTWTPAPHVADPDRVAGWRATAGVPSGHAAQLRSLLDSFDRRERPQVSGVQGRETMELVTGIYRSAATGRSVARADLVPGSPHYDRLGGDLLTAGGAR